MALTSRFICDTKMYAFSHHDGCASVLDLLASYKSLSSLLLDAHEVVYTKQDWERRWVLQRLLLTSILMVRTVFSPKC